MWSKGACILVFMPDYQVISELDYDAFLSNVNAALKDGYQLVGGVAVLPYEDDAGSSGVQYFQAIQKWT
jgi:hypothetical protein